VLLLLPAALAAPIGDVAFRFSPERLSLLQSDDALAAYGFAPVGSPWVLSYGAAGSIRTDGGWRIGIAASFSFSAHQPEGAIAPTTTATTRIGYGLGRHLAGPLWAGLEAGFTAPLLFLAAEEDALLDPDVSAEEFARAPGGGVFEVVEGTSHVGLSWSAEVAGRLAGWFRDGA